MFSTRSGFSKRFAISFSNDALNSSNLYKEKNMYMKPSENKTIFTLEFCATFALRFLDRSNSMMKESIFGRLLL